MAAKSCHAAISKFISDNASELKICA
uniref:Uncharacterized protein n=1 Tax=Rhizophora mucronata TaxID=61149 RepID=A0A2P2PGL7_RHIMU